MPKPPSGTPLNTEHANAPDLFCYLFNTPGEVEVPDLCGNEPDAIIANTDGEFDQGVAWITDDDGDPAVRNSPISPSPTAAVLRPISFGSLIEYDGLTEITLVVLKKVTGGASGTNGVFLGDASGSTDYMWDHPANKLRIQFTNSATDITDVTSVSDYEVWVYAFTPTSGGNGFWRIWKEGVRIGAGEDPTYFANGAVKFDCLMSGHSSFATLAMLGDLGFIYGYAYAFDDAQAVSVTEDRYGMFGAGAEGTIAITFPLTKHVYQIDMTTKTVVGQYEGALIQGTFDLTDGEADEIEATYDGVSYVTIDPAPDNTAKTFSGVLPDLPIGGDYTIGVRVKNASAVAVSVSNIRAGVRVAEWCQSNIHRGTSNQTASTVKPLVQWNGTAYATLADPTNFLSGDPAGGSSIPRLLSLLSLYYDCAASAVVYSKGGTGIRTWQDDSDNLTAFLDLTADVDHDGTGFWAIVGWVAETDIAGGSESGGGDMTDSGYGVYLDNAITAIRAAHPLPHTRIMMCTTANSTTLNSVRKAAFDAVNLGKGDMQADNRNITCGVDNLHVVDTQEISKAAIIRFDSGRKFYDPDVPTHQQIAEAVWTRDERTLTG